MLDIILYISSGMILLVYLCYFLLILIGRNKIVSNSDSFDVTKDIISEYNSINIIETSSYFTIYNIKRKVIKLASKCYYGKDLSSISLALNEAGLSIIDNKKNKYINVFRSVFNNLKLLYIFPIIAIIISNSSFNIKDAKVSLIFLLLFTFISYIMISIKSEAIDWVGNNIKKIKDINKENRTNVINFMNRLLFFDKVIYFGEIIMIIRITLILFEIK